MASEKPNSENTAFIDEALNKEIIKASTISSYVLYVQRSNCVTMAALPAISGITFGVKGALIVLMGEGLNSVLGKSYLNYFVEAEHAKFIDKNWNALMSRWHDARQNINSIKPDVPVVLNGVPTLVPMENFPKDLKKQLAISAFKAAARTSFGGTIVDVAVRIVRPIIRHMKKDL